MKQQSVQRINVAKIRAAKARLASVTKNTSAALKQLTAQGITSASPEDVAAALTETVVPAIEEIQGTIEEVVEALPVEEAPLGEGEGLGEGIGNGEGGGLGGEGLGEGEEKPLDASFENHNTQPGYQGAKAGDSVLKQQVATLMKENIAMKKAGLKEQYASAFPPNLKQTAMDEFEEEFKDSEDLDKMEAKVATAKAVVKSYRDANMINKSRTQTATYHTAKMEGTMKTAKNDGGSGVAWYLRK